MYDIHDICSRYNIKNYTVNEDNSINVNGSVNISYGCSQFHQVFSGSKWSKENVPTQVDAVRVKYWTKNNLQFDYQPIYRIPIKFNIVTGNFNCSHNELTSLENCPKIVGGYFSCSYNRLQTLENMPKRVEEDIICTNNRLISLKGSPEIVYGNFDCSYNLLESLYGSPKEIIGAFICRCNMITTFEYCPKCILYIDISYNLLKNLKGLKESSRINSIYNTLPKKIFNIPYEYIIKWQNEYTLWDKDGSLNEFRWSELQKDYNEDKVYKQNYLTYL